MQEAFLQILPLALAATISPTGLLLVMAILSGKDNPRRKALEFILGALLFLICLNQVLTRFFPTAFDRTGNPHASAMVDIGLGVLIVLIVAKGIFFPKKKKAEKEKKRKQPYFIIGFFFMIVNTSTLIPFIAASKIISDAKLGSIDEIVLDVFLIVVTMALITLPVAVSYLLPKQSEKILAPISSFMDRHGKMLARLVLLAIAVYLIIHGAMNW